MKTLRFTLLGNPSIHLDNQEIFFSFAKINALLYYMVINGNVNRDEIAGILWEDKDTKTAKKNLRNSIYQVNKLLGDDYIISPNKSLLQFNPETIIKSDVSEFSKKPLLHLSLYKGEFLQNFFLKNNETYDLWLTKMRSHLEQVYIKTCYQNIDHMMATASFEEIEEHIFKLISIDEFEERHYQLLMKLYQKYQRLGKVIETYYKLVNLLDQELGIAPSQETQSIYEEVVAKDRNHKKIKKFLRTTNDFFGRLNVIKELEDYFNLVYASKQSHTMLLLGGTGIGKKTVTRQVLSNQTKRYQIVTAECFHEENSHSLQVIKDILEGLGDLVLQYQLMTLKEWNSRVEYFFPSFLNDTEDDIWQNESISLTAFMIDIIKKLSSQKATVILIEDIHWMSADAVDILQTVINHLEDAPLALVLTKHLNSNSHLDQFFNHLISRKRIDFLKINNLSEKESMAYLKQKLDHLNYDKDEYNKIYQISEGNPFFLSEYTNLLLKGQKFTLLTPAIEAKLSLKLKQISSQEEELLYYLSCFRNPPTLELLAELMTLTVEETIEIIEALCQKQLLLESTAEDHVIALFKQKLMAHFCYSRISLAKRRLLHAQIAKTMEKNTNLISCSKRIFDEIAYHYQEAKQPLKSLYHHLNYLEAMLQFQHELFPIYSHNQAESGQFDQKRHKAIQTQFDQINHYIQELRHKNQGDKQFQESLIRFLYLEGCYKIRVGQYQQGISDIQNVIAIATEWQHTTYLLESYRQIIHYCIQVENISEMKYYTELALEAAITANNYEAIAIQLRLSGLYHLMTGNIGEAVTKCKQSIDLFTLTSSIQSKYAIQIAAAYDYLAEIKQIQGKLADAVAYQEKAIQLSLNKRSETSILSFYIGLGISYYHQGNNQKAQAIFMEAKEGLKNLSFPWKEVQLEVYLALINSDKGNFQPLIELIHKKEDLIARYSNPRDKGMIYYLMAITKDNLTKKLISDERLECLLNKNLLDYLHIAKRHLNPYRDCRQIDELEKLEKTITSTNTFR